MYVSEQKYMVATREYYILKLLSWTVLVYKQEMLVLDS